MEKTPLILRFKNCLNHIVKLPNTLNTGKYTGKFVKCRLQRKNKFFIPFFTSCSRV